ncbi:hypothetical protein ABPG72_018359 [Tetrahymena utriculariae]
MNLQDKISNQSYIYYTIMYEKMSYITPSLIKTSSSQFNTFDNNNFEYFYGSTSYYPYSRSCATSKQIILFHLIHQDRQVSIGSFKLYKGGFVQECDECRLKIDDQECRLKCANSSDYLEQGKYYYCKSSCNFPFHVLPQTQTCSFIPDQGQCTENQGTDRFFSDKCTCPKGQYLDNIQKNALIAFNIAQLVKMHILVVQMMMKILDIKVKIVL